MIVSPTVTDIAREKLAVVRAGATLVTGAEIDPDALALARATVAERDGTHAGTTQQTEPTEAASLSVTPREKW